MKYKDYYQILGVGRDATPEQIKTAYRKLARKYHPDVSKEADAEERFKDINEAHEVLGNAEKRAAYDQLGSFRPGQDFRPPPDWEERFFHRRGSFAEGAEVDFGDLFSTLFGGAGFRQRGFAMGGEDYEVQVEVGLDQANSGTETELSLSVPESRPDGTVARGTRRFKVRIPKGVTDGQKLRVPGKGGPGRGGGPAGDLFLTIRLRHDPLFRVSEHDLYIELPVTPSEAVLGTEVEVPTLQGRVRLKIRPGARSGQKMRVAGKGMAKPGGGHGDLYAIVQVVTPPEPTPRERELYEELSRVAAFDPRRHFEGR